MGRYNDLLSQVPDVQIYFRLQPTSCANKQFVLLRRKVYFYFCHDTATQKRSGLFINCVLFEQDWSHHVPQHKNANLGVKGLKYKRWNGHASSYHEQPASPHWAKLNVILYPRDAIHKNEKISRGADKCVGPCDGAENKNLRSIALEQYTQAHVQ